MAQSMFVVAPDVQPRAMLSRRGRGGGRCWFEWTSGQKGMRRVQARSSAGVYPLLDIKARPPSGMHSCLPAYSYTSFPPFPPYHPLHSLYRFLHATLCVPSLLGILVQAFLYSRKIRPPAQSDFLNPLTAATFINACPCLQHKKSQNGTDLWIPTVGALPAPSAHKYLKEGIPGCANVIFRYPFQKDTKSKEKNIRVFTLTYLREPRVRTKTRFYIPLSQNLTNSLNRGNKSHVAVDNWTGRQSVRFAFWKHRNPNQFLKGLTEVLKASFLLRLNCL